MTPSSLRYALQLTSFAPPIEQAHINAPLLNTFGLDFYLHPCLYGPFLLELSDPLTQVVVEWDKPWLLGPPYMVRFKTNAMSTSDSKQHTHGHVTDGAHVAHCSVFASTDTLSKKSITWQPKAGL